MGNPLCPRLTSECNALKALAWDRTLVSLSTEFLGSINRLRESSSCGLAHPSDANSPCQENESVVGDSDCLKPFCDPLDCHLIVNLVSKSKRDTWGKIWDTFELEVVQQLDQNIIETETYQQ